MPKDSHYGTPGGGPLSDDSRWRDKGDRETLLVIGTDPKQGPLYDFQGSGHLISQ